MRISKVITKRGDKGKTSLGDGSLVSKAHPRIKVLGELDELNAVLGVAITACSDEDIKTALTAIQNDLFNLGGEISIPDFDTVLLSNDRIQNLEDSVEKMNSELPPLKEFILPGGDEFTSRLHVARAVCRRTERSVVEFLSGEIDVYRWIQYLNRLSDYLFVLARYYSHTSEKIWETQRK